MNGVIVGGFGRGNLIKTGERRGGGSWRVTRELIVEYELEKNIYWRMLLVNFLVSRETRTSAYCVWSFFCSSDKESDSLIKPVRRFFPR